MPILIKEAGLSALDIKIILHNAPSRYKRFYIKKRNGGMRRIAQPAREVKILQRALIKHVLSKLDVHDCALAYQPGRSILDNAMAHAGQGPIRKYDFSDFFPSIRSEDWLAYCNHHNLMPDPIDRRISTQILFHREPGSTILRLSIGAPSSPITSNILMHEFDSRMAAAIADDRVTYTRYADDLTFSAPRTGFLNHVEKNLKRVLREVPWPRLTLNPDKSVVATVKYRREVTGLVLTNDGKVSLGREKKRNIRAEMHRASLGKLDPQSMAHLAGMLAYIRSVEPAFIHRLENYYGVDLVAHVQTFSSVSRRER